MVPTLRQNIYYFLSYAVLFAICISAILFGNKAALFNAFNRGHIAASDLFFAWFTNAGDGWVFATLVLILLFVRYRWAFAAALAFGISSAISQSMKHLFFGGTPRPLKYFEQIQPIETVQGVEVHSLNSFPSGHTATAFAICTLLALMSGKKKTAPLLLIPAILVGISRMYLGQHFFEDVTAGSFIGTLSALLAWQAGQLLKTQTDSSLLKKNRSTWAKKK